MGIETFRNGGPISDQKVTLDPHLEDPASFSVTTQMMQDAVQAQGVSVADGSNKEALFANPFKKTREEALVLDVKNQLTYLERTDASGTGWVQNPVLKDETKTFSEVVIAVHPNRNVWAFCVPTVPSGGSLLPPDLFILKKVGEKPDGTALCSWEQAPSDAIDGQLPAMKWLSVSYSPEGGPTVIGQPPTGYTCVAISPVAGDPSSNFPKNAARRWTFTQGPTFTGAGRIVGGGYYDSPLPEADGIYVYYVLNDKTLTRISFHASGPPFDNHEVSTSVAAFCGTWNVPRFPHRYPQTDVGYIYLDGQGTLVTGYFPPTSPQQKAEQTVKGLQFVTEGASAPRSWQDAAGRLHIFGITRESDPKGGGTLRVLHQSAWQSTGDAETYPVFPEWTSARLAGAPTGIADFSLMDRDSRLLAFDYTSSKASNSLLAVDNATVQIITRATTSDDPFRTVLTGSPSDPTYSEMTQHVVAYDFTGSKMQNHLLCYHPDATGPGQDKVRIYRKGEKDTFELVYKGADIAGLGIYDETMLMPFDYTGTGKNDHLLYCTPIWLAGHAYVLAYRDGAFQRVTDRLSTLGGFDLNKPFFMAGLDYNSKGSSTHLLAYRPGTGKVYVVTSDGKGGLTAVIHNDTGGIGGWDLALEQDRLVPFDYTGQGFNDHILTYRPAPGQQEWVLERMVPSNIYVPIVQGTSMAGYDFASPDDTVTPYDFYGTSGLPFLIAYRPGTGKVSVFGQRGGEMAPVYQAPPGPSTLVTVGLQANVASFLLDPQPDFKPSELIKLRDKSAAEAYCLNTQDINTSQWHMDKIRLPHATEPATYIVSHYVAVATLLSLAGHPLTGHNVTVSADSLVEVQIGDISYQVGPGRAITATTNAMGKVVLSIAARGLNPPVIHLNADGLEAGTAIDFAGPANDFLAGHGTLPSQRGPLTPTLLQNAKAPPNQIESVAPHADPPPPLVPNWDSLKERGLTPQVVVDHCSNAYAQAASTDKTVRLHLDGLEEPQAAYGYVIQLWDPDRPAFQAFRSRDELEAYKAYRNGHPAYGGWWDDAVSWASDVWEGIKSGAARVAEVIVAAVTEVAIWVGEAIVSLGEMIIDSVEQAVQAVEAVFQMVADAISRVIDWLKSLFDFHDIWETKTALQTGFVNEILPIIGATFGYVENLSASWFNSQVATVHKAFQNLKDKYGDARLGDFQNKVSPIPTSFAQTEDGKPVASGRATQAADLNTPQANWMLSKATAHGGSGQGLIGQRPDDDDYSTFMEFLFGSTDFLSFTGSLEKISDLVSGIFAPDSPESANQSALSDFLDILEKVIVEGLTAAGATFANLLAFAKKAGTSFELFLRTPLDLGFANSLYGWVQENAGGGDPPTVPTLGDVGFLVAAFFETTIHKLIMGVDSTPFPGGKFPSIPKPPYMLESAAVTDMDPDTDEDENLFLVRLQASTIACGVLQGLSTTVTDLINPMADIFEEGRSAEPVNWLEIINGFNCIVGAWNIAATAPPVLGTEWLEAEGAPLANWVIALFKWALDALGTVFAETWDKIGRSTLLKNAGKTVVKDLEKVHSIIEGSAATFAFGIGAIVAGEIAASRLPPEVPTQLKDIAYGQAAVAPFPLICQVARPIAHKWFPKNWQLAVWGMTSLIDGLSCAIGNLLIGIPATIELLNAPDFKGGTYTVKPSFTLDLTATGGSEGINKPLTWSLVNEVEGVTIDEKTGQLTGNLTVNRQYTVKVRVTDNYLPPLHSTADVVLNVK
ncbi:hypothetical protein GCM10010260_84110 [Streptomyces filipinensis]|uniref:Uncharacterized protein n=1 Tax=Streptomyces filipinensis TaxID=66887 RepID=A0A918MGI4_9ACTN|nr:cadherin repeat domain-containing protein [Streptomyces filipinensis]GGV30951.1 hypothetical protein GCM10010260_84110 [Streptomyces filipinensis]